MARVISSALNIFFSLLLGAIALAFCAVQYPESINSLLVFAEKVRGYLTSTDIPVQYNIWVKFLIQDQQLVFMFFVIMMRVLFALLVWGVSSVFRIGTGSSNSGVRPASLQEQISEAQKRPAADN